MYYKWHLVFTCFYKWHFYLKLIHHSDFIIFLLLSHRIVRYQDDLSIWYVITLIFSREGEIQPKNYFFNIISLRVFCMFFSVCSFAVQSSVFIVLSSIIVKHTDYNMILYVRGGGHRKVHADKNRKVPLRKKGKKKKQNKTDKPFYRPRQGKVFIFIHFRRIFSEW